MQGAKAWIQQGRLCTSVDDPVKLLRDLGLANIHIVTLGENGSLVITIYPPMRGEKRAFRRNERKTLVVTHAKTREVVQGLLRNGWGKSGAPKQGGRDAQG